MISKEFPKLLWIRFQVSWFQFVEFLKVTAKYYRHLSFFCVDLSLLSQYFWHSPFAISKQFLIEKGEDEIYAYGETPLTTFEKIVRECGIGSDDTVYELGCGRGRTVFWLHHFIGCRVVGIEYIPVYVEKAEKVRQKYNLEGIEFRLEDIRDTDYSPATVLYLYGTCFEDDFIQALIEKFRALPKGTKLITVSYPLTDYTNLFTVQKQFPATFTWGTTEVYLQLLT